MSIKLYNGMRAASIFKVFDLLRFLDEIGKEYDKEFEVKSRKRQAFLAVHTIDLSWYWPEVVDAEDKEKAKSPAYSAWTTIQERRRKVKVTNLRDPLVDDEFTLVVYPSSDGLLILPFTENYLSVLKNSKFIKPFGYWDNVDPEEGVSDGDWNRRKLIWQEFLGSDFENSPARAGLTREYEKGCSMPYGYEEIKLHLPTLEQRAAIAKEKFIVEESQKIMKEQTGKPGFLGRLAAAHREVAEGQADEIVKVMDDFKAKAPVITDEVFRKGLVLT